ncbi:MAG: UbiX family flavin prenyltransferase [Candidatus Helarchaeota archaeon]
MDEVVVGITGASGIIYGIALLRILKDLRIKTHLIISKNAEKVITLEAPIPKVEMEELATEIHDPQDYSSPLASGSCISTKKIGLIIVPCSMKTLAAIAHGYSDNLLTRVADVFIKEKKPIILVPRETPFSGIHLENMLKLANYNITILPPIHAFYTKPKTIDDLVNQFAGKILISFGISNDFHQQWNDDFLNDFDHI